MLTNKTMLYIISDNFMLTKQRTCLYSGKSLWCGVFLFSFCADMWVSMCMCLFCVHVYVYVPSCILLVCMCVFYATHIKINIQIPSILYIYIQFMDKNQIAFKHAFILMRLYICNIIYTHPQCVLEDNIHSQMNWQS